MFCHKKYFSMSHGPDQPRPSPATYTDTWHSQSCWGRDWTIQAFSSVHLVPFTPLQVTTIVICLVRFRAGKWPFSSLVFSWVFKWPLCLNVLSHSELANSFSLVWIFTCLCAFFHDSVICKFLCLSISLLCGLFHASLSGNYWFRASKWLLSSVDSFMGLQVTSLLQCSGFRILWTCKECFCYGISNIQLHSSIQNFAMAQLPLATTKPIPNVFLLGFTICFVLAILSPLWGFYAPEMA